MHTRFIELAGEINASMPSYVVNKLQLALNQHGKSVNNSKILIVGLAYKKNIDDARESPAVYVIDQLQKLGASVFYHDPYIDQFPDMRDFKFEIQNNNLSEGLIKSVDGVVIITDHSDVDYELIKTHAKLIVDTRNVFEEKLDNVFKA